MYVFFCRQAEDKLRSTKAMLSCTEGNSFYCIEGNSVLTRNTIWYTDCSRSKGMEGGGQWGSILTPCAGNTGMSTPRASADLLCGRFLLNVRSSEVAAPLGCRLRHQRRLQETIAGWAPMPLRSSSSALGRRPICFATGASEVATPLSRGGKQ